ncbi:hypothetical protein DV736_g4755, partial [Chaetothyriales sp. CBS 134916]
MSGLKHDASNPHSVSPSPPSRSSLDASSPPGSHPALRVARTASVAAQHRQSFNELRGAPPSPRSQRQPSITQIAVQELIDNPPQRSGPDPQFAGRDWRTIRVQELTSPDDLRFVDAKTTVEAATNLLIGSGAPVLLIREDDSSPVISTFDYRDLTAYLLMVVGLAPPDEEHIQDFIQLAQKAREGTSIPLRDIKDWGKREPLTFLSGNADLIKAIELFGKALQRIVVVDDETKAVTGLLSQSRLVRFLWENGRHFPVIDQLYGHYLRDLKIGSNNVIAINGDRPLAEALTLLHNEGVSSLPVLDNASNVVGNISVADVKLLTKSSSLPLLRSSCIHFISIILNAKGIDEGKDSVPVFYVTPMNTLAHTVAKLVATKSHRLWVTEPISPSSSGPPTPSLPSATLITPSPHSSSISAGSGQYHIVPPPLIAVDPGSVADALPKSLFTATAGPSISASSLPGQRISGKLVGVVSLTDILILFARAGGLHAADPSEELSDFAANMRKITNTYTNAFKSAEVLAQRDFSDLVEGVRIYERKYREEQAKVETAKRSIQEKEDSINDLNMTLRDIVRVLGTFIQSYIHEPQTEEVMQIIADYTSTADDSTTPHVRMLEVSFNNMLSKHANAQADLEQYRAITVSQDALIKDQNEQLVKHTQKYEACLRALKAKNDEIATLGEKYVTLKTKLAEYENGLGQSKDKAVQGEALQKYIATLKEQAETLAKGVASRDSQIESLLSQVRKRGGMRKSQPMQAGTENAGIYSRSSSGRQGVMGQGRDSSKPKRSNSASAVLGGKSGNASPAHQAASTPRQIAHHRRSSSASSSIYSQEEDQKIQPSDPFHSLRPRSDSPEAPRALQKLGKSLAPDVHQRLAKSPPTLSSASSSYPAQGVRHDDSPLLTSRRHKQLRSVTEHTTPSAGRGMLSDIPEVSAEERVSPYAPSTTSSDREVYRRSMSALNALNKSDAMSTMSPGDSANDNEVDEFSSEGSELLTVSEMYHEGTHHLTS